jgi:hypothetical protein
MELQLRVPGVGHLAAVTWWLLALGETTVRKRKL